MANPKKEPTSPAQGGQVIYRDTRYNSRVLILPDGCQMAVARCFVMVLSDDDEALKYLERHPDLKLPE
jgi:hypothetical protein